MISPFAKHNFVDHTVTYQSSVILFVEDNWLSGQRITGSFDAIANSITQMLEFKRHGEEGRNDRLFLNDVTRRTLARRFTIDKLISPERQSKP